MGILEQAQDIKSLGHKNFHVIYGKSASGKTTLLSTYPKPLLYVRIGDDGSNTIADVAGIKAVSVNNVNQLHQLLEELEEDDHYATVAFDTFSMVVNEWIDENAVQKNKRMSMQMWGDIKTETEELIRKLLKLASDRIIVATCHEVTDMIEGLEEEVTPDIRPNVSKGARTYLEGMANYGFHCTVIEKESDEGRISYVHALHLGTNPYYWVKTQKSPKVKVPKVVYNPTYTKIMKYLKGERKDGKKA